MKKKKSSELYGVIGLGRFGFALAQTLATAGKEVLVVDSNEAKIKEAIAFTDNAFTVGVLTKENLQAIGIQNCDVVIICIGENIDISILTTLNVLKLGVKRVISKAISAEQGDVLEMMKAEVVYPERDMAIRLANKLIAPRILEYISLSDEMDITEIQLPVQFVAISVVETDIRHNFGLNIIAVKHGEDTITDIYPDLILYPEDMIVVIGKRVNISRFEEYLKI